MLICCFFNISLIAQSNNTFRGKILFQSSGKKPAVGVEISGLIKYIGSANTTYTTHDGAYFLVFLKAGVGNLVHLNIGDTDSSGQLIELVNEEEVKNYMIPQDATQEFEIIVCKKGERDAAAQRYYKIIKTSADFALEKMEKEFAALSNREEKNQETINLLSKKIATLKKQNDTLVLQKEAYFLASINKDKATQNVLNFLNLLDNEETIEEALSALSFEDAKKALETNPSQSDATVKELEIIARISKIISDYEDAIASYKAIIEELEKRNANQLKIARYFVKIATLLSKIGKPEVAAKYMEEGESIQQDVEDAQPAAIGFYQVEVPPTFLDGGCENLIGGEDQRECTLNKIIAFLKENIDIGPYITSGDDPKVTVLLTINTEGGITDINVNSNHYSLINKAIDAIKKLPKMIPGKHGGKNVNTTLGFQVIF